MRKRGGGGGELPGNGHKCVHDTYIQCERGVWVHITYRDTRVWFEWHNQYSFVSSWDN